MKIVLVDDEEIVLKGLRAVIEKSGKEWQITGLCGSGDEALAAIEEHGADVVITDIHMSGMSGLELAGKLKANYQDIIIILLTGYAEFSYAKKAIGLSAFDYLLKPAQYTDIIDCLTRADNHLEKIRSLETNGTQIDQKTLDLLTEKFLIDCMKGLVGSEKEFSQKSLSYSIEIHDFTIICAAFEQLGNQFNSNIWEQSILNYALRNMAEELFAQFGKTYFIMEDSRRFALFVPLESESEGALSFIAFKYIRLCRELLGVQMRMGASRKIATLTGIRSGYAEALASLEKSDDSRQPFISPHEAEPTTAPYSKAVQDALVYIHEHFSEEMTLKAVAKLVFLNTWYFSELFKKEVGTTFTDYVMSLRIKKAKELLANKRLSLYQISYMVGINAPGYFSQVFRRSTGLSPKEYRKSLSE